MIILNGNKGQISSLDVGPTKRSCQLEISLSMWKTKTLLFVFLLGFINYAHSDELLKADIARTYQSLSTKPRFEDRLSLVDVFVQRASERREAIIKQRTRTNTDILVLLRINILRGFHHALDKSSSASCTRSLARFKTTLYSNRFEEVMFPFEKSIYDLHKRMCSLNQK